MQLIRCVTVWIVATALAQQPAASGADADSLEIARLERIWNQAHLDGDAAALDRLWSDDLVVTVPGMPVMGKPETMGIWRSRRMTFQLYETSDLRIRVYRDAAVVTGRLRRTRTNAGREVEDDWRFTKVYIRRAGNWLVVAFHASEAPQ
jgi:ketosteroid isomerase-like protein